MSIHTGKELATTLRTLCDAVQQRLWIASPYIGTIEGIRRIIGRQWWDQLPKDNVRLLTDADEANINPTTLTTFRAKGPVKTLRGLHAKLYIIDDQVLLTSANLTRTAFACRHEIGILLTGPAAQQAITHYETWWNTATNLTTKQLDRLSKTRRHQAGEDTTPGLQALNTLPPDPGPITISDLFADYEPFRTTYEHLARQYEHHGRAWPTIPLYIEVDAFLDYLFHHNDKPSHPYNKKQPRQLTPRAQQEQITTYARAFHKWADPDGGNNRITRATTLQGLLARDRLPSLTSADIRTVLGTLNCMQDERIKNRVLQHNNTRTIKHAWTNLLYGTGPLPERMSTCAAALHGFKRSSVQELLGWYDPTQYPIRNTNTNAGMRFLGYDVTAT